jgi:hypothetical protein
MNETMGNAISRQLSRRAIAESLPLFEGQQDNAEFVAWERGRHAAFLDLLQLIPALLDRTGPVRRLDQWKTIVENYFLQFQKKEHTGAVKELYDRGVIGFMREDGSARLSDSAVIYLIGGPQPGDHWPSRRAA